MARVESTGETNPFKDVNPGNIRLSHKLGCGALNLNDTITQAENHYVNHDTTNNTANGKMNREREFWTRRDGNPIFREPTQRTQLLTANTRWNIPLDTIVFAPNQTMSRAEAKETSGGYGKTKYSLNPFN